MKALLAGWFSFEHMGATAGDIISCEVTAGWLARAGVAFDVAFASPFSGGLDWQKVDPREYDRVVFVCGPFANGRPVNLMLERFAHCRWFGLNLSMLKKLDEYQPFEALWERDSDRDARPDMVFLSPPSLGPPKEPLVGVVLVHPQGEYGPSRARHEQANAAIERLILRHGCPIIRIDTRLDQNTTGQTTAVEVESLIARTDVVLTTRLHGTVLALKNGVPVIAIDPIAGGAKITRQARTIGWPHYFDSDQLDDDALDEAFAACLKPETKALARQCARRAQALLEDLEVQFIRAITEVKQAARPNAMQP